MKRTVKTIPSSRFACQSIPPAVSIFTTLTLDPRLIIPGPPSSFQSVECLVGNKKPRKRSRRRARVSRREQKWLLLFPLRDFSSIRCARSVLPVCEAPVISITICYTPIFLISVKSPLDRASKLASIFSMSQSHHFKSSRYAMNSSSNLFLMTRQGFPAATA